MREKICTRIGKNLLVIETRDILRFSAEEKYVIAHTATQSLCFEGTLKELEVEFAQGFLRIHRTHLVRRELIGDFRWNGYLASIALKDSGIRLPVGRSRCVQVRALIEGETPGCQLGTLALHIDYGEAGNVELATVARVEYHAG